MHEKNFDEWNTQKKLVDEVVKKAFFHERAVWFLRIGENIGFEQNGKGNSFLRPVLVYKKFSPDVFLGIPLTSQEKEGKFYHSFVLKEQTSTAILSQIRLLDSKRLEYLHGRISRGDFNKLKQKLIELLQ